MRHSNKHKHEVDIPSGSDEASPTSSATGSPSSSEYQFDPYGHDDDEAVKEFFDDSAEIGEKGGKYDGAENPNKMFFNPNKPAVLDDGVHEIPGSPWAKPAGTPSTRPTEPLNIAKYASTLAFALAFGACVAIFIMAFWNYSTAGRILVEVFLGMDIGILLSNMLCMHPQS